MSLRTILLLALLILAVNLAFATSLRGAAEDAGQLIETKEMGGAIQDARFVWFYT